MARNYFVTLPIQLLHSFFNLISMLRKAVYPFLICFLLIGLFTAKAQLGISYHQSNLPFIGLNYTVADRLMPELAGYRQRI